VSGIEEIAAFLAARLDEAEARAWAVHDVGRCDALLYEEDMAGAAARTPDCDCGYPARVRREVEAGRAIMAEYERALERAPGNLPMINALGRLVKARAAVYSDHPDWREEERKL
jgi:Family of unknown function (DUF6221)